jgi:replicative DNA helicase
MTTNNYPNTIPDRLQPYNEEAEQAALGSLLIDRDSLINLSPFLRPGDFFIDRNRWIYEAIRDLGERNTPADLVTLCDELERRGKLQEIGGAAYLTSLMSMTPTHIHAEHYGHIVERTAVLRRLIDAAGQIARLAYEDAADSTELLIKAEKLLLDVTDNRLEKKASFASELVEEFFQHLDRVCAVEGITGIPTGLTDLDLLLGGLQKSDVIVIAGRPGMGKTALATQIAKHAGKRQGTRSKIFSLEMSDSQLIQRLVSAESGIPVNRLRTGKVEEREWPALFQAQNMVSNLPLAIDDSGTLTPAQLRSKAIRHHAKFGLDLIIVDYIQLMASDGRGQNRHQEIAEISRACKNLARELDIPIIVLSQLSRNVEYRADKRPNLADLRESGAIEADADVVAFIYRDEVYDSDTQKQGVAEIIIAKHRNGPTGIVETFFRKQRTEFIDLAVDRVSFDQVN